MIIMDAILKKNRLDKLFKRLGYSKLYSKGGCEVIAPVRKDKVISFEPIVKAADIAWDFANSVVPPKMLFFPQTEELFSYKGDDVSDRTPESKKRLVFALRPCDARSFAILDPLFTKDFNDPYYNLTLSDSP